MNKVFAPAAFFLLISVAIQAQNAVEAFPFVQNGDTTLIKGVISNSNDDATKLRLENQNYPAVTLPRAVLKKVVDVTNRSTSLNAALQKENAILRERDTLNTRELTTLRRVVDLHKTQVAFCDQNNAMLNQSINSLNTQLTETRQLARDCNKAQLAKKTWGLLVGGVGGFALGIILGVVAAK